MDFPKTEKYHLDLIFPELNLPDISKYYHITYKEAQYLI